MKRLFAFLLVLTFILVGCNRNDNEKSTDNTAENNTLPDDTVSDDDNSGEAESDVYNGFVPRSELEDKYFNVISNLSEWNSFVLDYNYNTYVNDANDIPQEIVETSRYVIKPFQLHRTYHSIYFRNDHIEQYVTENEAFVNFQMEHWQKEEDFTSYIVNPLLSRMDLFYSFILNSNGVVELDDGKIAVDILPEHYESIYEQIQLAFHHNIRLKSEEYSSSVNNLTEPLKELDPITVQTKKQWIKFIF